MAKLELFDLAEQIAIILQFEHKSNMQDLRDLLSLFAAACNLGPLTSVVMHWINHPPRVISMYIEADSLPMKLQLNAFG